VTGVERVKVSVEFVEQQYRKAIGTGYVYGRIDAGDSRLDFIDGMDFGDFYAENTRRLLDLPDLYERFVREQESGKDGTT
jgi:hypothetical protein